MRKLMTLLLTMFVALTVFAVPSQSAGKAGSATASQKAPEESRISGTIVRSSPDKSLLIVRQNRSNIERTVIYDKTTKWTKKGSPADMKEFKDGSRVICLGKSNDKGELTATRIDLQ
jgi:hypothetical protein